MTVNDLLNAIKDLPGDIIVAIEPGLYLLNAHDTFTIGKGFTDHPHGPIFVISAHPKLK